MGIFDDIQATAVDGKIEYNLRQGVRHLTAEIKNHAGGGWDLDELKRMRDNCEKYGLSLKHSAWTLATSRSRKGLSGTMRLRPPQPIFAGAQVGVKIITYHWELIPFRRNAKAPGRGGATYDCFKLEDNWKSLPLGNVGRVTAKDYWERITYFLERIIPVARENGVLMACHPSDPPDFPLVTRAWTNGIRRRFSMHSSVTSRLLTLLTMVSSWTLEPRQQV
jgi:mannonate dehydratase